MESTLPDGRYANVVLLAGGVGGARMAVGLAHVLPAAALTVIVNIGDDDDFHGLRVCPDLDTVAYTLSGQINRQQAWGVDADTTRALDMLKRLGAEKTWMTLGDADLGLHLYRTQRLGAGMTLTEVTGEIARAFGIRVRLLPASNEVVTTHVRVEDGVLRFQEWFVQQRCNPRVFALHVQGAASAMPSPEVAAAITNADLIVVAPSNPLLSIQPILEINGVGARIQSSRAPKVVVSPLIGGKAVKGPLDRLMKDLGWLPGNAGIADIYGSLLDGMVIDRLDQMDEQGLTARGLDVLCASTRIAQPEDAERLACHILSRTWRKNNHERRA